MAFFAKANDLSSNVSIKKLASQTTATASSIVTYRANFVYNKLERGLEGIKRLKILIYEKKNGKSDISTSTVIENAKEVFHTLYEKFGEIDKNSTSIREGFERLIKQTFQEYTEADNEVRSLEKQRVHLEKELENSKDLEEQRSIRSQIEILKTRIKVWSDFRDIISQLPTKSEKMEKNVVHFLKIIHLSVPIYYQAYMALTEIEEIRDFLSDIKALAHLDILSDEIENSWSDISNIVKSIESISRISQSSFSSLKLKDVKIHYAGFFENVIEFFQSIWNFFFHPKIYTWEDVAKIAKEMNENLKSVIEEF